MLAVWIGELWNELLPAFSAAGLVAFYLIVEARAHKRGYDSGYAAATRFISEGE